MTAAAAIVGKVISCRQGIKPNVFYVLECRRSAIAFSLTIFTARRLIHSTTTTTVVFAAEFAFSSL